MLNSSRSVELDDETLCGLLAEDSRVCDILFKRHIEAVTGFLRGHIAGIEHEAVASEALYAAIEYATQHPIHTGFRALVFRIARRQGWKARQQVMARAQQETALCDGTGGHASLRDMEESVLRNHLIAQALKRLTVPERALLRMRYEEQFSEFEIASQTRKSVSAVKSGLYHARQKLRFDPGLTLWFAGERRMQMGLKSWHYGGSKEYTMTLDRQMLHNGKPSVALRSVADDHKEFGSLIQGIRADRYRGKRIRLSAYVKPEGVEEWAGLWMRIDGPQTERTTDYIPNLGFDNMENRPIRGTGDWQQYAVVLDVPQESTQICFGFLFYGKGQAWVAEFGFEEVDKQVPTTGDQPDRPQNLDFTEP